MRHRLNRKRLPKGRDRSTRTRLSVEEEMVYATIGRSFEELKGMYLGESVYYREKIADLRSIYCPNDDFNYFQNEGKYDYNNYDGNPVNSLQRATAGFMTYHVSPFTKFFGMNYTTHENLKTLNDKLNYAKTVNKAVKENHRIVQQAENMVTYAKNYRDKVIFNITGKTIENDKVNVCRMIHHAPEDLMVGSTDGYHRNIYGVRKKLNNFQAYKMFGPDANLNLGTLKLYDTDYKMYWRFNIQRKDMYLHLSNHPDWETDPTYQKVVRKLLGVSRGYTGDDDEQWVDFWISEYGLVSLNVEKFRRIIISQLNFANYGLGLGKGIGELAAPTHCLLTELEGINLIGYEKTFDPPFGVHSESEALGVDLGRGGYAFYDDIKGAPKNLSIQANVAQMVEYKNYTQARFDRICMLDVFMLINKSRMTGKEVDIRSTEGARFLGPFVLQDSFDDLNPTIKGVNALAAESNKRTSEERSWLLNAYYTSPLTRAHKASIMDEAERVGQIVQQLNEIAANPSEMLDDIDPANKLLNLIADIDDTDWIRERNDAKARKKTRLKKEELEVTRAQQDALAANSNALRASEPPGAGEETEPAEAQPAGV